MKSSQHDLSQGPTSAFTKERLGYGLLVGVVSRGGRVVGVVALFLSWLLTKLNIAVLLYLLILEWPGNLVELALGFGVLYELSLLCSNDLLPGQVRKAKPVGAKPSAFHNINPLQINL